MADTFRYNIIDADNNVVNTILWDGDTEYDPGPGLSLKRADKDTVVVEDSVHQVFEPLDEELVTEDAVDDPTPNDFPYARVALIASAAPVIAAIGAVVAHLT